MNVAAKVAKHFSTTEDELFFDEASYFGHSLSCTVKVSGVWHDVWFDSSYNITNSAEAN